MKRVLTSVCGVAMIIGYVSANPLALTTGSRLTVPKTAAVALTNPVVNASHVVVEGVVSSATSADYRDLTIPAGTVLPVVLETSVGSDTSHVEQPVRGSLRRAIHIRGTEALPPGTVLFGHVTRAQRPGKVKGRGVIAMRFDALDAPGRGHERISTATVSRMAPATKEKDALEILAPAAGGAVVGRLVGGKKGAAEGALIGGGAGTAYVLSTRGKDIRLGRGASLAVRLTAPVTVRVPVG
jgi:hypothetical protein